MEVVSIGNIEPISSSPDLVDDDPSLLWRNYGARSW